MVLFWIIAALSTIGATWLLLRPISRNTRPTHPETTDTRSQEWQSSWNVLAAQREEIESDLQAKLVSAEDQAESIAEWKTRAGAIYCARGQLVAPPSAGLSRWVPFLASAVVLGAGAMYLLLGNPKAANIPPTMAATGAAADSAPTGKAPHPETPAEVQAMVKSLEARLAQTPDNVSGWALLARSKARLGDFEGAALAYRQAVQLLPDNPDLLTDFADVLAMAAGRKLDGEPMEMIQKALSLDPKHPKGLALAATAAMRKGKSEEGLSYWRRLRATFADGSDDAKEVDLIIAQISSSAANGKPALPIPAPAQPAPPAPTAATPATVASSALTGQISLSPELQSKIKPGSVLFILARAAGEGAPRMPLAVKRASAPGFPVSFTLDDSMAMAPGVNLSSASQVEVEARISLSGQATPQTGDLRGRLSPVKPGSTNLRLVIDSVLP